VNARKIKLGCGLSFDVYRGADGVLVAHVDTDPDLIPCNERGPEIRVYINDGDCFLNPSVPEVIGDIQGAS
jgi:hypothetical protein